MSSRRSTMDVRGLLEPLQGLKDGAESIARRMLVAGGVILRDEAKERAPEGDEISGGYFRNPEKTGSKVPGTLKKAIYLSRNDRLTGDGVYTYVVSWNSKTAFWGRWAEFGHNFPYMVVPGYGGWTTLAGGEGAKRSGRKKGIAPRPSIRGTLPRYEGSMFLGIAYDLSLPEIQKAALAEGAVAFNELIQKVKQ